MFLTPTAGSKTEIQHSGRPLLWHCLTVVGCTLNKHHSKQFSNVIRYYPSFGFSAWILLPLKKNPLSILCLCKLLAFFLLWPRLLQSSSIGNSYLLWYKTVKDIVFLPTPGLRSRYHLNHFCFAHDLLAIFALHFILKSWCQWHTSPCRNAAYTYCSGQL